MSNVDVALTEGDLLLAMGMTLDYADTMDWHLKTILELMISVYEGLGEWDPKDTELPTRELVEVLREKHNKLFTKPLKEGAADIILARFPYSVHAARMVEAAGHLKNISDRVGIYRHMNRRAKTQQGE